MSKMTYIGYIPYQVVLFKGMLFHTYRWIVNPTVNGCFNLTISFYYPWFVLFVVLLWLFTIFSHIMQVFRPLFSHGLAAEYFPDRSEVQCLHRWQKVLNPELIKGPWTQEVFCWCYLWFQESFENSFLKKELLLIFLSLTGRKIRRLLSS